MSFICLPIFFGCPTKLKPEGDQTPRICPRCHNAAVHSAKSRMWFELCFVPLIPMTSEHIWLCNICQWTVPTQQGWEPPLPNYGIPSHGQPIGFEHAFRPGYQPIYIPLGPQPVIPQAGYQPSYPNQKPL